jgi:hypothetical protein
MYNDLPLDAMPNSLSKEFSIAGRKNARFLENTSKPRRCHFVVACLALVAYIPLVWHSETSGLTQVYLK